MRRALSIVAVWGVLVARTPAAQQSVTRAAAVAAALTRGARVAVGRADSAAAAALLHGARAYPNPSLTASYSKDLPHHHLGASLPLDLPWVRSARVGAAAAARDAAVYGFGFERASIRFETDTAYTQALAALARSRLSRRNALDADSLLAMARLRREVGDVSELDVRLAEVNAGQLENIAADDSLSALAALLAVQLAMGLSGDQPAIALADPLQPPPDSAPDRSEERALAFARRSVFATPSLELGFDQGDPTTPGGLLPVIGFSLPLPLFNWNGGDVARARAARDRALATLDLVRRETAADVAGAQRRSANAVARVARDRGLLRGAERVAGMALQAYAEGAIPLANVLEAQRNAREALGRYIDDVAAANNAAAALRLLTAPPPPEP